MGWRARRVAYDDVLAVRDALQIPEVMAWAMVRRGLTTPQAAREFIDCDGPLDDPGLLPGIDAAAARLATALDDGTPIAVHGDYDCDGVCSTALLTHYLRRRGGQVRTFMPSRFDDGYGVHQGTVDLLADEGTGLLVCVDCGTAAAEPLAHAVARGMDVIVLDHHLATSGLPPGIIANPALGPAREDAPAAVGVVLSVVRAMAAADGDAIDAMEYVDLAALATVADAVPLLGQNRRIVARGLAAMRSNPRPGIAALCRAAGIDPRSLDARHLGFSLAPSINAAGRLTNASEALDVMLADDADQVMPQARRLWELNEERREIERRITEEAIAQVEALPDDLRHADTIVASGDGWHEGVVGIVASRLVDRFERPAIVISRDGENAKGSGRSLPGVDLHALVGRAADRLTRWGGHAGAVGLQLAAADIAVFRDALREAAAGMRAEIDRARVRPVDAVVGARELDIDAAEALQALAPYGRGNPAIRLLLPACRVENVGTVGQGKHLEARLALGGAHTRAVGFHQGHRAPQIAQAARLDAHISLSVDRFRDVIGTKVVIERAHEVAARPPERPCAPRCDRDCTARHGIREILAALDTPPTTPPSPHTRPPRSLTDLRGLGVGLPRITALAGADAGVAVVVADVALRRPVMDDLLAPSRLGVEGWALVGGRCEAAAAAARLAALPPGPALVFLEHGDDRPLRLPDDMHVLVLDPPADAHQAARVTHWAAGRHLHLVWGDEEIALAREVSARTADVRATAAAVWRVLRTRGHHPWDEAGERALRGEAPIMTTTPMLAAALQALREIGLIAIDDGGITVVTHTPTGPIHETAAAREAARQHEQREQFLDRAATLDLYARHDAHADHVPTLGAAIP